MTNVVWFRQDLRTSDNPALTHAARKGPVIALYVLDETEPPRGRPMGAASRWWLHNSLDSLTRALGGLVLLRGDPITLVPQFARAVGARGIFWNRCYEPQAIARDKALKSGLSADGFEVASFNGGLLFEPWEIRTGDGGPYKVYTPFWRACLKAAVTGPQPPPSLQIKPMPDMGVALAELALLPVQPDWAEAFPAHWQPGEEGARKRLLSFLDCGLDGYAGLRDRPDLPNISSLSPHLHFGEISPRQVWAATQMHLAAYPALARHGEKFLAELGWREFASHLLYHFPELPEKNWKPAFDAFPWQENAGHLKAWQEGKTGYPFVDAGMRELWATGFMHNRVRMIAASFLIKHLRIDWRQGERWFWDTLVDADPANNAAGWQWVAGSGADASPYFRIFNPIEQGRRFDPDGTYVRRWCPELSQLPNEFIHAPFQAPEEMLRRAQVSLGETYPHPIVDHAAARAAALAGYEAVRRRVQES